MESNRREFIKKSASLAALSIAGVNTATPGPLGKDLQSEESIRSDKAKFVKDAGMQMCLAYFFGMQPQKIALARQMNVLGAVGGINPRMVGLNDVKPWDYTAIVAVKEAWKKEGLQLKVIEGPPQLDKAKLGIAGKDEEIENFITFMKNIAKAGIDTVCYNWMPVINWARTTTDKPGRGGALVTSFNIEDIKDASLTEYGEFSKETMWKNLEYFLKAVVPEAEKNGIKLALHPDDPPVDSIRGISRIMTSADAFKRMIEIYPSPNNGITLCQGTFATMGEDIPSVINYFGKRKKIHFVHFRDVRGDRNNFEETFHDEGKTDMHKAMKTYYEVGFRGPIRPDHVPTMAGDSNQYPGYSIIGTLFAIGYMRGLMEAISKSKT